MKFSGDWWSAGALGLGALGLVAVGCGGDAESSSRGTGAGSGGVGQFGNAGDNLGPGGGAIPGGGTGAVPAGGSGGVNTDGFIGACGGDAYQAEARPLHIYTLYDDSGSMSPWWFQVGDAFIQFVNDPRSAGISVGLKFFGSDCNPAYYAQPEVPIGEVTQNAATIAQTLQARAPFEGTATTPALQGGLMAAQAHAQANPDAKVVMLLVTDGAPDDCGSSLDTASAAAMDALNQGIPTYVLGLGDINGLNALAVAGGTGAALSADPTNVDAVVQKMNEIRGQALPCDYAVPADADDLSLVNLQFLTGGNSSTVPGVSDVAACDPAQGGWYYDNPAAPTRIIACDQTCGQFKAAADGQVNVVLGCPTISPD